MLPILRFKAVHVSVWHLQLYKHFLVYGSWLEQLLIERFLYSHSEFLLIVVVQSLSHVWLSVTPWTTARQASLSFIISQSLLKLTSIELVMPSTVFLCRTLLLLPSIFPNIRVFTSELALCIRCPKYWNFSICPFNEYSRLISYRIDWFGLLVVQETLKSLL